MYTLFDVKAVFLTAVVLFEVGSAICGAAPGSVTFIVGRAIAGLGAGGVQSGVVCFPLGSPKTSSRPPSSGPFAGPSSSPFELMLIDSPLASHYCICRPVAQAAPIPGFLRCHIVSKPPTYILITYTYD